jgi:hypothetical protein
MANPEHLEILKQGVERWNTWRKERPDVGPDLRGAHLQMRLSGADLLGTRTCLTLTSSKRGSHAVA